MEGSGIEALASHLFPDALSSLSWLLGALLRTMGMGEDASTLERVPWGTIACL